MTGGTHRGVEDLLRERLHEVDSMDPPHPDFEFRALRAGQVRLTRRRSWTRGLVGAAAAVAAVAVVVPLARGPIVSGGGSSAGSAMSAPSAPGAQPDSGTEGLASTPPSPQDSKDGSAGPEVASILIQLRASLARTFPETYTALSVDDTTTPSRVVLHLSGAQPEAERMVRGALPTGVPVVVERSAFSAAQCATTLATVQADAPNLASQGYALGSVTCGTDGRVVVQVTNLVTAEQIQILVVRYADAVRVEQVVPAPTTS